MKTQRKVKDLASVGKIKKIILMEQLLDKFGVMITEGYFKPGKPIPSEKELAKVFGVSNLTVRQALRALDAMGIIEVKSGSCAYLNESVKKIFINPMKFLTLVHQVDINEINQIRRLIEIPLAGLAAEKATEQDIKAIEYALKKSKENRYDIKKYLIYEMAFHEAIFKASGNRILEALMSSIFYLLYEVRSLAIQLFPELNTTLSHHKKILKAIKNKETSKAEKAMEEHLIFAEGQFAKVKKL